MKTAITVLLIVTLLSAVFYITLENSEKREILIWQITADAELLFSSDTLGRINDYATECGVDKVVMTKRHPEDRYFDAVMSTTAFYNCDIFIMNDEMMQKYVESDMFLPLETEGIEADRILYSGDRAIGVSVDEEYYLLINQRTDIDLQIIYDIFDILLEEK